ncbi:hypothetical protein GCM10007112_20650 [Vulcanisaeta souniana JCM 11219]|uniref:Uncharacterized protein n=1 Tax=Vulcanisaeta souniana JCM 11219 TaxID=1293586 RepID=A0A830E9W7_9CREN|nr:hypothetical protein GCM10007112_20650 [Vulcanisaeta souniana JCM 11219]
MFVLFITTFLIVFVIKLLFWMTLLVVLMALPTLTYAQIFINYIGINIDYNNQTLTQIMNITGNQLVIPIYQYCSQGGYVTVNTYLDPLSNLGITSAALIMYNGSIVSTPINYSPKYVSANVNCSLPIYGLYLSIGSYGQYPLEALVIPGSNMTYVLTQGSMNISIPLTPGLNYLFALVRVISILPARASINNYLTAQLNTEYSNINVGSLNTYAEITTYVTYSSNVEITTNGTTYIIITPYYYTSISSMQNLILLSPSRPIIMLTGAPWIKYSYSNCTPINPGIPGITPWTSYLSYSPYCSINITTMPVDITFVDTSLQKLTCNNVFITTQNGEILSLSGSVAINPAMDRVIYLVINGIRTIGIYLDSIPASALTIQLPLVTHSGITITDELGNPVDAPLYLYANGTLLMLTNNTCVYPGNYSLYTLVNGELMSLGTRSVAQDSLLTIPVFSNYTLNISIPQQCPDLDLNLLVKYSGSQYVIPLNGNLRQEVYIPNAIIGSYIQVYLVGNGTLLYQSTLLINGSKSTSNVVLNPHVIDFTPVDLLNNEIPTATLNIGSLYYEGPGKYCVPTNSSLGMVIYGSDVYIVNITGTRVFIRVWTLGNLGVKSLLIIASLLILLLIISIIIRGLSKGGGSKDKYIVIN